MKRAIQQTFMVSALAFAVSQALALPKEPTIVNGNVQITPSSNAMEIQHSAGAIVNWKGFDIDNGQTVKFVAPNEQAAILNRVFSGNASTYISGRLESNGRVFLINPNGIIFGYSSVVDVGGLVASTLNITNENFLANHWLFESTGKKNGIEIKTGSQINIKPNSYLWLFGNRVTNTSTINAQASMVVMAAGEKVYVSESDSSNMFFEVTPNAVIDSSVSDNNVNNNEDAYVDVMQGGHFGAFGYNIIQAGKVYLDSVDVTGGNAIFSAKNNLTLNHTSKIYNSGAGQQSGNVYLQAGNAIKIEPSSSIRVKGDFGGVDGSVWMTAGQINDSGSINAGGSNLIIRNYAYNTLATPFFTTLKSDGQQTVIAAGSVLLSPVPPVVTPPTPSGTTTTSGVGTVSPPPNTTATTPSNTQSTGTSSQSGQTNSSTGTGSQSGQPSSGTVGQGSALSTVTNSSVITPSNTQSTVEGGGAVQGSTPSQSSMPSATEGGSLQNPTNVTDGAVGISTPVSMPSTTGGTVVIVPEGNIAAPSSSGSPTATEVNTGTSVNPASQVTTGNPVPIDVIVTNPNPPILPPSHNTGAQSSNAETGVVTEGVGSGTISSGLSGGGSATAIGTINSNQPSQVAQPSGQISVTTVTGAPTATGTPISNFDPNQPPQVATGAGQTSTQTVTTNQGSIDSNAPTTPLNNTNSTPPSPPAVLIADSDVDGNTSPTIQPQTAQQYLAAKNHTQLQDLGTQFANAPVGSSVTINVVDANGITIQVSRLEWITALKANNQATNFGTNTGGTGTVVTNSPNPTTVPSNTQTNNTPTSGGSTPSTTAGNGGTATSPTTSIPPVAQQPSGRPTTTTNGGVASSPNNVTGSTTVSVIQNPALPLNSTTPIPVGSRPTTGNGSVAVNNNTTAPVTVTPPVSNNTKPVVNNNPVAPTLRPQTIQEYFANKDRNEIKRLFANAPIGNSTVYVTDKNGFSLPVTRKEWIGVMSQKGQIVNDLQSDLEFLKTLSSSEAQSLWNNYNLGYIGESNTAAYPLSNGESRFISRTAWDNDQKRRNQEIYTSNQRAEAASYVQNVSQAKLNDLRVNFDQQAYHSMFGSSAQDNKIMVGLPSGNYGLSKTELDKEQARRNVIETERQNKLAAQRALQASKEQVNSNNFSFNDGYISQEEISKDFRNQLQVSNTRPEYVTKISPNALKDENGNLAKTELRASNSNDKIYIEPISIFGVNLHPIESKFELLNWMNNKSNEYQHDVIYSNDNAVVKGVKDTLSTALYNSKDIVNFVTPNSREGLAAEIGTFGIGKTVSVISKTNKVDNFAREVKSVTSNNSYYDSNTIRAELEAIHGKENVTSTTVANKPNQRVNSDTTQGIYVITDSYGNKAVKVDYVNPVTKESLKANIPYDSRGLPVFDDVSKYTTKPIDTSLNYVAQMRQATKDLRDKINAGVIDKNQFTNAQLKAIQAGDAKIPDYTWHHNAQSAPNNMQLIPTKIHEDVLHTGQKSLSKGL